jgi:hypothetical protein
MLAAGINDTRLHLPALPDMICSARQTWHVAAAASLPVIDCDNPDTLIDDVFDVLDDEPPAVIIDFDCLPPDTEPAAILEALQQLQITIAVPLIFGPSRWVCWNNCEALLRQGRCHRQSPPRSYGALSLNPDNRPPEPGTSS